MTNTILKFNGNEFEGLGRFIATGIATDDDADEEDEQEGEEEK